MCPWIFFCLFVVHSVQFFHSFSHFDSFLHRFRLISLKQSLLLSFSPLFSCSLCIFRVYLYFSLYILYFGNAWQWLWSFLRAHNSSFGMNCSSTLKEAKIVELMARNNPSSIEDGPLSLPKTQRFSQQPLKGNKTTKQKSLQLFILSFNNYTNNTNINIHFYLSCETRWVVKCVELKKRIELKKRVELDWIEKRGNIWVER